MTTENQEPSEDSELPPAVRKLAGEEGRRVLLRLLRKHQELIPEAEEAALDVIGEIGWPAVAREVQGLVESIDFDDVGRGGRRTGAYVEPTELAWEGLEAALQPYLENLRRLVSLGQKRAAIELCRGIVEGLESARGGDGTCLLTYAPDFQAEWAAYGEKILAEESRREHGEAWRL